MSTTNVKILLRRGLRKDISHDTLVPGEMGFTVDTNQLYIGIENAIDEVQFDPFANAQATIQSWLNSVDNPEPGLIVDEDLIIRDVQDIDKLLSKMHYFEQVIVFDSVETFTAGETLYQYVIEDETETFTSIADQTDFTINKDLTPKTLWSVSTVKVDGTVIPQQETDAQGITTDNYTVTGQVVKFSNDGSVALTGGETVDINLIKHSIYTQGEILLSYTDPVAGTTTTTVKVSEPSLDPYSNPYMNGFYKETVANEDDYYFSTQSTGTVEPTKATTISVASEFLGGLYGRSRKNTEVVTENSFNNMFADQHLVSQTAASGLRSSLFKKELKQRIHGPDKLEFGLEYKILDVGTNTDAQENWNTVAGTTRSPDKLEPGIEYTIFDVGTNTDAQANWNTVAGTTGVTYSVGDTFTTPTSNFTSVTEETGHGSAGVTYTVGDTFTSAGQVAMETGQGSALTIQGTFMSWDKNICTSFFIDYSLVQTKNTSKFVRVGSIKVINGVPQGINDIKLTDDNTEIWQDLNSDTIADVDEFSNIEFTAKIEGNNIKFMYEQEVDWETEISYTIKRWTM